MLVFWVTLIMRFHHTLPSLLMLYTGSFNMKQFSGGKRESISLPCTIHTFLWNKIQLHIQPCALWGNIFTYDSPCNKLWDTGRARVKVTTNCWSLLVRQTFTIFNQIIERLLCDLHELLLLLVEHVKITCADIEPHSVQPHFVLLQLVMEKWLAGNVFKLLKGVDLKRWK